jgi:hypothetical protein
MKFGLGYVRKSVEKIQVSFKCDKTLHEPLCICVIIHGSILLRMRNVSDMKYRETENTFCIQ